MKDIMAFSIVDGKPHVRIDTDDDHPLIIPVDKVVSRINRKELLNKYRFHIVNEFMDRSAFDIERFKVLYGEAVETIYRLESLPQIAKKIEEVANLFNYSHMVEFIERHGYTSPVSINKAFDRQKGENALITEDQTYLHHEYIELLPLMIVVKAITPLIALSIKFNPDLYLDGLELFIALKLIKGCEFYTSEAMDKLNRFIYKHVTQKANAEELSLIAMRRNITQDDIYAYILANAIFKKIFTTVVEKRPEMKSIINEVFSTISSALSNNSGIRDTLNYKREGKSQDDDPDGESWAESYRQASDLPLGIPVEFDVVTRDTYDIYRKLGGKDETILRDALKASKALCKKVNGEYVDISDASIMLLNFIIMKVIPPKALEYLPRERIAELLACGFGIYYEMGFKKLAQYLLIVPDLSGTTKTPVSLSWIKKDIARELTIVYPVMEESFKKGEVVYKPTILDTINNISNIIQSQSYVYVMETKYLELGSRLSSAYGELRSDIGSFLLELDRRERQ